MADSPTYEEVVGALRSSLGENERLRTQNRQLLAREAEPIAIVGMSCRYPSGVSSPDELWDLLANGRDAITGFPTDRGWDLENLHHPDPDHPTTTYATGGGFLDTATGFDRAFFGISPREALAMDPQQRVLLEAVWEVFENAGIRPATARGTRTGVYAGISSQDYGIAVLQSRSHDLGGYVATGNAGSIVSGRVAYTLGLQGPAVTIDTACSSSLVAIDLACQALRSGECSAALACGVTILASPSIFVDFSRQRGLAPDGRCKAFSDAADGTGWSEGVGVLLLERLSEAHAKGRQVLAVIRGSAVNQDGASNGLTAPNGRAQERVIRQALSNAGLTASQIDAVEAHGTGTALGDPIEAQALLATYGRDRERDPLWLGSIKSNIGHTQAAAGVAGVIKMVTAMRQGVLPKTLHVDQPTSNVDWSAGTIALLQEQTPWQRDGEPRRAGVSSFGISGTNAHVILEEAPVPEVAPSLGAATALGDGAHRDGRPGVRLLPWTLSAKSAAALRAHAERVRERVVDSPHLQPADVGLELAGRSVFKHRAVVLGAGREDLESGLEALIRGQSATAVVEGVARTPRSHRLALLFTGQGAQHAGMGRELYRTFAVFREALDECCAELDRHLERSLLGVLLGEGKREHGRESTAEPVPEGLIDRTLYTQSALFALEVALFRLIESLGLRPDFLLGHSIGEIVAAHVAGVLSLKDACTLVAARGGLMDALPAGGAMVALGTSEQDVLAALRGFEDRVALAAVNGPLSVVISGDEDAVIELEGIYAARDIKTKRLRVSHAFHSQRMDGMLHEFSRVAQALSFAPPTIPIVSNLTGEPVPAERICTAEYWVRHAREPVRFADGVRWLRTHSVTSFLELGPESVLSAMSRECFLADDKDEAKAAQDGVDGGEVGTPVAVSLLRGKRPEAQVFFGALAEIWAHGGSVDWERTFDGSGAKRVALPTYPFQREHHWVKASAGATDVAPSGLDSADHPLLGAAIAVAGDRGLLFSGEISLEDPAWLADHVVLGVTVVPGTSWVELALFAGSQVDCDVLEELIMEAPLLLSELSAVQLQVFVGDIDDGGGRPVGIYSRPRGESKGASSAEEWTRHASGVVARSEDSAADRVAAENQAADLSAQTWPPEGVEVVERDSFYQHMAETGFEYGPAFFGVQALWRRGQEVFAELSLTDTQLPGAGSFGIHPALLDAGLQAGMAASPRADVEGAEESTPLQLPFSFNDVRLYRRGASALRVRVSPASLDGMFLLATDENGELVASMRSLAARPVSREQLASLPHSHRRSLFHVDWTALPEPGEPSLGALALLGAEDSALARCFEHGRHSVSTHGGLQALADTLGGGSEPPAVVLSDCAVGLDTVGQRVAGEGLSNDEPIAARSCTHQVLELLQRWLADERFAASRLVLITHAAVAVEAGEDVPGLAQSPVWGLVRSAQSEHPERFVLVDIDDSERSWRALAGALSLAEPQLALRNGELRVPRLAHASTTLESSAQEDPFAADSQSTVLITGGTGALGALLARHLVVRHRVRHLLLVSRRGPQAEGALELQTALQSLGAEVSIAACDVADREDLVRLLGSIPAEHPLCAVVHTAGALDDGTIESLTAAGVDRVLAPKADAAWHLHQLTAHLDLRAFVLFSSVAGTLGSPGQSSYSAASVFLDSLACYRRARGLTGLSLAWGPWEQAGMAAGLSDVHRSRIADSGMGTLSGERGLELFDAALDRHEALIIPAPLDLAALASQARAGVLPAILTGIVRAPFRQAGGPPAGSLALRLAAAPEREREHVLLEVVRTQVAAVLGHASADAIDARHSFKELGFDSLAAVDLRTRLNQATGLRLPATLVFDYPTATALAGYLLEEISGTEVAAVAPTASVVALEEPVAIVGMSCRYPGGVRSPEELWQLVSSGTDAISTLPTNRGWDLEQVYDPDPDHPGTSYTREGGFLYDADEFDAGFFGISPREALAMDPQQRLLLEATWEALEDAGLDPASLRGSRTGVFAGINSSDYGTGAVGPASDGLDGYRLTGLAGSVASGRVSYTFGFEGPTMSVDTACSSSLVALHLASQALRAGECSLALAGGVTVMSTPYSLIEFCAQRASSPDGRCKSFAEGANGAGWSEGVGMLLLERLSEAHRNGHRVLGLVRGSAVNQDGASNGLTAPNGRSQQRVMAQALANARLTASQIDAVEAHGTGTALGDPIEAQALLATYGRDRGGQPLWLGSIKSNIGHTVSAAGVAGVIKMVMAMRHGLLPKTLHVDQPTSNVDWSAGTIALLQEQTPWQRDGEPRRAGVSSFGISGTNAHVVLEEAPPIPDHVGSGISPLVSTSPREPVDELVPRFVFDLQSGPAATTLPWVVSGRGDAGLCRQAGRLARHLRAHPDVSPVDVGLSLASTRAQHESRRVILAGDRAQRLSELEAVSAGELSRGSSVWEGAAEADARVAVLFSGQGSQRVGMGSGLYSVSPVFRTAFDEVCAGFDRLLDRSLRDLVLAQGGGGHGALLDRTEFTQCALFALEVALFRLVEALGVRPALLIGHSIGELAAAHVAGVCSLEDACRLVAARGGLMGALPEDGAMVSVEASEEELLTTLAGLEGKVALAAVNGPRSVVVSGDETGVLKVAEIWRGHGRRTKRLRVSHAFHSPLMEPMLEDFRAVIETVDLSPPSIPVVSNVTGESMSAEQACSPDYWMRHVREPVRLLAGVRHAAAAGISRFLELGPDAVLTTMVQECAAESGDGSGVSFARPDGVVAVPLLRRDRAELESSLTALAELWVSGAEVDWHAAFAGAGASRVALPTYAFKRERYWLEAGAGHGDLAAAGVAATGHPVLAAALSLADGERWLFTGRFSLQAHPWLADRTVAGNVVFPAAGLLELALHAAMQVGCEQVVELALEAPLVVPESGAVQVQVAVGEVNSEGQRAISIHARTEPNRGEPSGESEWVSCARGALAADVKPTEVPMLTQWPPPTASPVDIDDLFDQLASAGFEYGAAFQRLSAVWRDQGRIYAEVDVPTDQQPHAAGYVVHPVLLEALLDGAFATIERHQGQPPRETSLFSRVGVPVAGSSSLRVCVCDAPQSRLSITLVDEVGESVRFAESVSQRDRIPVRSPANTRSESLYRLAWVPPTGADTHGMLDLAVLGSETSRECDALRASGCSVHAYQDLAALSGSIQDSGPDAVLMSCEVDSGVEGPSAAAIASAHAVSCRVLDVAKTFLADDHFAQSRLILVTLGAVGALEEDDPHVALAPVWGLVRSAQAEHPGRFTLVDVDDAESSWLALGSALASGEPQIAMRDGVVLVPRLGRVSSSPLARAEPAVDLSGTVLITGGTGAIGREIARHLVASCGASHLVLASRSGPAASGSAELIAEIEGLGAQVKIVSCDVTDRGDLTRLVRVAEAIAPLRAVVHAAGVLDDGVLESLTEEQVERVLGPKADAALHLHELTKHLPVRAFVLFSSAAATIGSPGQGNYSAANAILDTLAKHRHAMGLPATSIAWGLWGETDGLTGNLSSVDLSRLARSGVGALTIDQGLALFDASLCAADPCPMAARLDIAALRAHARAGVLPAVFDRLVGGAKHRASEHRAPLARRLAAAEPAMGEQVVLGAVRHHVATVLGHGDSDAVPEQRDFKQLGFTSLAAVELRNRLAAATGLQLPPAVVFNYPTPIELARHLLREMSGGAALKSMPTRPIESSNEPIAVVSMSCRFPGGVETPRQLWELVLARGDAIGRFPVDRGWDLAALYDPDPEHRGTTYVRHGGFLHDAPDFDADFFGISPNEAVAMDPQQRMLLETTWEAMEAAGIDPESLRGSRTGVYVGISSSDYAAGSLGSVPESLEDYGLTGNAGSVVSGRVAYTFGLEGPAVTVDTACSSSLVAIHLACQALRSGECSSAIAGGVTVLSTPATFVGFARHRGLSHDGRCRSFSDTADGAGFSEGAGLLLLERLSEARRNGHRVLAVIGGSAVNQDGASNGLAAPNGPSQRRVIEQALANARISAPDVDAVEAHGTGTELGDPIEAQALIEAYGQNRDRPLWLGSIKSNIGHTQAAAGVAGVIKMVMALRAGVLPPTLYAEQPTTRVDWSAGRVALLTDPVAWPAGDRVRRAGVSAFGVSGTNAHLVLEQPPADALDSPDTSAHDGEKGGMEIAPSLSDATRDRDMTALGTETLAWVLSAKGPPALRALAARTRERLASDPRPSAATVAAALAGRSTFQHRAVVIGSSNHAFVSALQTIATGGTEEHVVEAVAGRDHRAIFLFPGHGSQWNGMAADLLETSEVFAEHIRACEQALGGHVDWSLDDVLRGAPDAPALDRLDVLQPVLFSIMVSLAALWRACGVEPAAVVGHSQGEIAAAHVAGGLTLDDAARLVALRSQVFAEGAAQVAGQGRMAAISLGVSALAPRLERFGDRLAVAVINGPAGTVVSGETKAVESLLRECAQEGIRTREIPDAGAGHSPAVAEWRERLLETGAAIRPLAGSLPFYSTVTGGQYDTALLDAEYWYRNARQTVQFEQTANRLLDDHGGTFIEVSPHPVLLVAVRAIAADRRRTSGNVDVVGSLRRNHGDAVRFMTSLAEAWVRGVVVDWSRVLPRTTSSIELPTYAFQRRRYWLETQANLGEGSKRIARPEAGRDLLGEVVELAGGELLLTGRLSLDRCRWLGASRLAGTTKLPDGALLELALTAATRAECDEITSLTSEEALMLVDDASIQVQVRLGSPDAHGARSLTIHSRIDDQSESLASRRWTRHAVGAVQPFAAGSHELPHMTVTGAASPRFPEDWPPAGERVELGGDRDSQSGQADHGARAHALKRLWLVSDGAFAEVKLEREARAEAAQLGIHPALLDGALDAVARTLPSGERDDQVTSVVQWRNVRLLRGGASSLRIRILATGDDTFSLYGTDERGAPVIEIEHLVVRRTTPTSVSTGAGSLFGVEWRGFATPVSGTPSAAASRGMFGASDRGLASSLRDAGVHCETVGDDLRALKRSLDGDHPPALLLIDFMRGAAARLHDGNSPGEEAKAVVERVTPLLRAWTELCRDSAGRLVVVTRDSIAIEEGEALQDRAGAAMSGLLRSAAAIEPQRVLVVDVDGKRASWRALLRVADEAAAADETRVAIRDGIAFVPRLTRATLQERGRTAFDPERTALVTCATADVGATIARHLVDEHGVRSVILAPSSTAFDSSQLAGELASSGADLRLHVCDLTDAAQLDALLATIPAERPLGTIVHGAALLELAEQESADCIMALEATQIEGAWRLHAATTHLDLRSFVLVSSAANLFHEHETSEQSVPRGLFEALVAHRRAEGLNGCSIAFTPWRATRGVDHAQGGDRQAQRASDGAHGLTAGRALELFDAACERGIITAAAIVIDTQRLLAAVPGTNVHPLLRDLVGRGVVPETRAATSFSERIAGADGEEGARLMLEMVLSETVDALGTAAPGTIDPDQTLMELGFDSLTALSLRDRLSAVTALDLPAPAVLDHPTPALLADYLSRRLLERDGTLDTGVPPTERDETITAPNLDSSVSLLRQTLKRGNLDEVLALLAVAAGQRETFDKVPRPELGPTPVRLCRDHCGEERPAELICLPSLVMSGPYQFARFAQRFEGRRELSALAAPGFIEGEPLPATLDVAIDAHVSAISNHTHGRRFALAGYSSGGLLAIAVTARLESCGSPPTALVLLDSAPPNAEIQSTLLGVIEGILARESTLAMMTEARLTAMATYMRLLSELVLTPTDVPVLLVKALDSSVTARGGENANADWGFAHDIVDVPGDHFSILEQHAGSMADAVQRWLTAPPGGDIADRERDAPPLAELRAAAGRASGS